MLEKYPISLCELPIPQMQEDVVLFDECTVFFGMLAVFAKSPENDDLSNTVRIFTSVNLELSYL